MIFLSICFYFIDKGLKTIANAEAESMKSKLKIACAIILGLFGIMIVFELIISSKNGGELSPVDQLCKSGTFVVPFAINAFISVFFIVVGCKINKAMDMQVELLENDIDKSKMDDQI